MSTYAIIFWTVVVTLVVVWLLTNSDWASKQEDVPTEWERAERQRKMLEGAWKATT